MFKSFPKSSYIALALVMGALVAGATSVFAFSSFGKKLEIAVDLNSKPKSLSLVYTYDQSWGWYITAATTLKAEDIADLPEKVMVKVMNLDSGKVFYSNETSKKILLNTNLIINNEEILREFLPGQKNAAIVISNINGESLYYLPLSDACSYSPNVSNLSKIGKPACVVDAKDFANKAIQCEDQKAKLLEYIKLGYTTCASAKEIYSKLSCGDLDCNL